MEETKTGTIEVDIPEEVCLLVLQDICESDKRPSQWFTDVLAEHLRMRSECRTGEARP
ncbi:hypothetical protein WEI85_05875 [Actinomycetes bacterium KLBMP 9797]